VVERTVRVTLAAAFWLPLAVCTWLALTPSPPQVLLGVRDEALHGFAFAYLAFVFPLAHPLRRWWAAGLWLLAYGALIELLQGFSGARVAEWKDFGIDAAGIALGLAAWRVAGARVRELVTACVGWLLRARTAEPRYRQKP
jgi:VanZ family protein